MSDALYTMKAGIKTAPFKIHSCCSSLFLFLKFLLRSSLACCKLTHFQKSFQWIPLLTSPPQTCRENNILGDKLVVYNGELWQFNLCHSCDCIITPTPVKFNVICCIAIYKNRNKQLRYTSLLTSWRTVQSINSEKNFKYISKTKLLIT